MTPSATQPSQYSKKDNLVILIHGLHQAPFIMRPLAKRLQSKGFHTHQYGYRSMRDGIKINSERLNAWLETNHDPNQPIDMVAHSLGGLIMRDFIYEYPNWKIGHCVTLGTPHLGSICADYVWRLSPFMVGNAYANALDGAVQPLPDEVTLGVIAGDKPYGLGQFFLQYHNRKLRKKAEPALQDKCTHDGTVYVWETKLDTANDHITMPVSHTGMLVNASVAEQVAYFLKHGRFKR